MNAFADPHTTRSERFDREDYLLGEAPNAFLARETRRFAPGSTALAVADIHEWSWNERTDDVELAEGAAHAGRSALVDPVARRR